jgi:hypothetical protein
MLQVRPMDSEGNKCRRRRLAGCASFSVDECDCGAIHLTMGYVTMRLDPCAYREMSTVMVEALAHLCETRPPTIH